MPEAIKKGALAVDVADGRQSLPSIRNCGKGLTNTGYLKSSSSNE